MEQDIRLERDERHRYYIDMYRNTGDKSYVDKLYKESINIIKYKIQCIVGYSNSRYEEFLGESLISFCNCVSYFDVFDRTSSWINYLCRSVKRAIINYSRYLNRQKRDTSSMIVVNFVDDRSNSDKDVFGRRSFSGTQVADPYNFNDYLESGSLVEEFIGTLTQKQKRILVYKLQGKTHREIGELTNTTFQNSEDATRRLGIKWNKFKLKQVA